MNLLYAEVIDIFEDQQIRMAKVRVKGATKAIPLLADAARGDKVLVCDGVAIGTLGRKGSTMCLAIPGKLIETSEDANGVRMGKANFGGIVKEVCLEYTPQASPGDYVLVHVGFALGTVDEAEAARTYNALKEMEQLDELAIPDVPEGYS